MVKNFLEENRNHSINGSWPLLLKCIAMPLGREIYSERSKYTLIKGMNKVALQLVDRGFILSEYYDPVELLRTTKD